MFVPLALTMDCWTNVVGMNEVSQGSAFVARAK